MDFGSIPSQVNPKINLLVYRPVGPAVTRSSVDWKVCLNLGSVKSYAELPTARYRFDISPKEAVLPERNDAEIDPANSLHASNENFDLTLIGIQSFSA